MQNILSAIPPMAGGSNVFLYVGIGVLVVALIAIVVLVVTNKKHKK
ncbi:MAG: hypothetical protein RRY79_00200 [Clostridia bacterium]